MKTDTLAGTRTQSGEPPRSTAYYYADLERLKKNKTSPEPIPQEETQNPNDLSEYVESNEVINDGAIREVPPFRDRRQWSLPEYSTPENTRKLEETYSTAGTFPMPEPKEKEPLLAELEVVGRLPLTQLDSSPGVRRSRSWYLCCPNVADEEISRESSWRYSSLRPVTAPPLPGQNGMSELVLTHSSGREDVASLRAERDALARALSAERQRAATAARAHDARLAELHGVIAELVRRRAADKHAAAIPEEELSDECESTTQPAGELDNDADRSRTEQNDSSSMLSPEELPTPQEPKQDQLPDDTSESSTQEIPIGAEQRTEAAPESGSLHLSGRDSELCLSTARCCQFARGWSAGDSCERGSEPRVLPAEPGRCESRQAKVASRVRLRKTDETDSNQHLSAEEAWCAEAAERLALDVCAQADLREALAAASNDDCVWRVRWLRAAAEERVLRAALARSADTARRLLHACGELEAAAVAVCAALAAADRALEAYDVLLALAETSSTHHQREAAESVALQLLRQLDGAQRSACIGRPLLSPGPWLSRDQTNGTEILEAHDSSPESELDTMWKPAHEARLREHCARLKAETVSLRATHQPRLFSYHDIDEEDIQKSTTGAFSMAEMEAAVMMQEMLAAREARTSSNPHSHHSHHSHHDHPDYKSEPPRSRRRDRARRRARASETAL
ncbi:uncharacterized protein LOC114361666 [Ostrinia furnacalis]|uniref:uncharacterized protein LOC114361666 n=2 Tax=Ostrinia TaxID=29056 RepID=UPI00103E40BD|nr:uncharacterized protein LOC114361666 [Ostrinia furnacalis]